MNVLMTFVPYIVGAAVFIAVLMLAYYALTTAEERSANKDSLRAIETYSWRNDELVAKEIPFAERVLEPVIRRATSLGSKFTQEGYVEGVRLKLAMAGKRGPEEVDRFLAIRVGMLAAMPVIVIILALLPLQGKLKLFAIALTIATCVFLPDARLTSAVQTRQKRIRNALPDILDLLTISVEAGLGFEQAIDRITSTVPGPLSDEFNRMMGEMRAGSSRADALIALEQRSGVDEVKSFVLSMVQADQFGVSIGRVLRAQADEMRIKRRQRAQEAAQKAPVKMLLPMTFLIFPALFVVILGPAMLNIIENFK